MVLHGRLCGRVGRRRTTIQQEPTPSQGWALVVPGARSTTVRVCRGRSHTPELFPSSAGTARLRDLATGCATSRQAVRPRGDCATARGGGCAVRLPLGRSRDAQDAFAGKGHLRADDSAGCPCAHHIVNVNIRCRRAQVSTWPPRHGERATERVLRPLSLDVGWPVRSWPVPSSRLLKQRGFE